MTPKISKKRSSITPIIGLILAIVVGVIAWFISSSVLDAAMKSIPSLRGNGISISTMRLMFTVVMFVLTLIIFGLIAALVTPKDSQTASESNLEKERDEMLRRQKAARAQKRKR